MGHITLDIRTTLNNGYHNIILAKYLDIPQPKGLSNLYGWNHLALEMQHFLQNAKLRVGLVKKKKLSFVMIGKQYLGLAGINSVCRIFGARILRQAQDERFGEAFILAKLRVLKNITV